MWRKVIKRGRRPRLGLALSGGAARGIAHVGVLKVFEEAGLRVDCVAGTSAGAIVGGALAAGMPLKEIEEIGRSLRWRDLGRMTLSRLGVQSNARMEEYIRASCAVPGWYVPVTDGEGRQLVDGGLVANLPSSVARALGAEVVVAVDVNYEGAKFMGPPTSVVGVLLQSFIVAQHTAVEYQRQLADVVISPAVGHLRWDEMERAEEFIEAGAVAARAALPAIKELLEPQPAEAPGWFPFRRR